MLAIFPSTKESQWTLIKDFFIKKYMLNRNFTWCSSLFKDALGTCVLFEEGPEKRKVFLIYTRCLQLCFHYISFFVSVFLLMSILINVCRKGRQCSGAQVHVSHREETDDATNLPHWQERGWNQHRSARTAKLTMVQNMLLLSAKLI